jgi:hypothetical protein
MSVHVLESRRARRLAASSHFTLGHDKAGWTLVQPDGRARHVDSFEAGVDSAREFLAPKAVSIDVWQDGEYICSLPPEQWAHFATTAPVARPQPLFPKTEQVANRTARVLMNIAGPLFWLALIVTAVAASLGWRLLVF